MNILVVEDEARIRSFVARGLQAEGFSVEEAADGRTGLRRALSSQYGLVVLDVLLPELDGLTLLRELHARRPRLPVLVLSARSDLQTKLRGFELGATDYLVKPFALDELLARVRVQLRRTVQLEHGKVLRAGRIELDLARRRTTIDGEVAELSDREFRLLLHLAEHADEVVSRERLLADVWGYHFDPGTNLVDVCIRRLRKRLGPSAPIETVRNAGYRLVTT